MLDGIVDGSQTVITFPFLFRLVGVFRMVLQKLIQDGHLEVMESLIDMNNTVLKVRTLLRTFTSNYSVCYSHGAIPCEIIAKHM